MLRTAEDCMMKDDNDLDNATVQFKKQLPRAVRNPGDLW